MNEEQYNKFLAHYGVQGMKWGVRKDYLRSEQARRKEKGYGPVKRWSTGSHQRRIDRRRAIAEGKNKNSRPIQQLGNQFEVYRTSKVKTKITNPVSYANRAQKDLRNAEGLKKRIAKGERRVTALAYKAARVDIQDINTKFRQPSKANNGETATLNTLKAVGTVYWNVSTLLL